MTTCPLCGRALPPLRWWQGPALLGLLTPPPLCQTDQGECRRLFLTRLGVPDCLATQANPRALPPTAPRESPQGF